jgi:hypothetical protein
MALILATVTNDARKYWPWFFGGQYGVGSTTTPGTPTWNPLLYSFKVGSGGWYNPGTGPIPRIPNPDLRMLSGPMVGLQDIDALVDATRTVPVGGFYGTTPGNRAWFEKLLVPSDFTYTAPNIVEIRCFLDLSEFNDNGAGAPPSIWELGIFSDHPGYARVPPDGTNHERLMVAYGTFPQEIKNSTNQIEHIVRVLF